MSCACASEPRHQLRLVNIIKHSEETYSYDLDMTDLPTWAEGDSSKVFLSIGEKEVGKAFSHATLPKEGVIRFTTRIKEVPSEYKAELAKKQLGDLIEITTPKGNFSLRRDHRPIVLLSNGVGIAATRSLVKAFEQDQTGIPVLIQINVDATGEIYGEEFSQLEQSLDSFKSRYLKGRTAFFPELKDTIIELWNQRDETPLFYVVGSEQFVTDTVTYLYEGGYTDADVVTDGSGCGCSSTGGCGCGSKKVVSLQLAM